VYSSQRSSIATSMLGSITTCSTAQQRADGGGRRQPIAARRRESQDHREGHLQRRPPRVAAVALTYGLLGALADAAVDRLSAT
jgi:hypothetical protein